jgi:branched-chain amino acid transport system substrate-binding protein
MSPKFAAAIAALAVSVVASACSSSSSGGAAPGSSGTSASPVKVMVLGSIQSQALSVPGIEYGTEAGAADINASGGLGGHHVTVITCNDNADPNTAAACAQQAVSDHVIAVVGTLTLFGTAVVPILHQAGIPYVAGYPISTPEQNDTISYPIQGGSLQEARGIAQAFEQLGYKSVNLITTNLASVLAEVTVLRQALKVRGISISKTVSISATSADMAPPLAAAATGGVGGIVAFATPTQVVSLIQAAHQAHVSQALAVTEGTLPPSLVASLGAAANNVYSAGSFPLLSSNLPSMVQFRADMKSAEPGKTLDDESLNAWAGMMLLKLIGPKLASNPTAKGVIAALNGVKDQKFLWLKSFSTTPNPSKGFSRIFNQTVFIVKTDNGRLVTVGNPVVLRQ